MVIVTLTAVFNFFYQGFLSRTLKAKKIVGEERDHLLFQSTTSTKSRPFKYLSSALHVRWQSYIFNRTVCIYQTATRSDLAPSRITIWLIDDVMLVFVCLLDDLILVFGYSIWPSCALIILSVPLTYSKHNLKFELVLIGRNFDVELTWRSNIKIFLRVE